MIDGVHTLLLEIDGIAPPAPPAAPVEQSPAPIAFPMANAIQSDPTAPLLQQFTQMQTMMMDLQRQMLQVQTGNTTGTGVAPTPRPAPALPAPNPRKC